MRRLGRYAAILLGLSLLVFSDPASAQRQQFWTLVAGGSAGSWYVGSAIISEIVNDKVANTRLTPMPGGGVANMRALQTGKAEFGYMFTSTAAQAMAGQGPFKQKHDKIRGVMAFAPMHVHLIVRGDGPIKTYKDLEGRKVSPGKRGFTGAETFLQLIREYGMSVDSIEAKGGQVLWLDYTDATENMRDGQIDALFSTSSLPHAPYAELASSFPIRIAPVEKEIMQNFAKKTPGWGAGVIPPGTYPGQTEAVPTLVDAMGIATSVDMPEEQVYLFTRAVWENRKRLVEGYPAYKEFGPEVVLTDAIRSIPLHPGAERYWREIGLLK